MTTLFSSRVLFLWLFLALATLGLTPLVSAEGTPTLTSLFDFTGQSGNGQVTFGTIIQGNDGNFYGTTPYGGDGGYPGTIFRMTSSGTCTTAAACSAATGGFPVTGVIQAYDGNYYGTTTSGAGHNAGAVIRMTPDGVLTALVSFPALASYVGPSGLLQGRDGNLYGVASGSTTAVTHQYGSLFKVTLSGSLSRFASFNGTNGRNPQGSLIQAIDGTFYGTTLYGGASDQGTVFKVTSDGTLTTLYSFNGTTGANPGTGVVLGADGNLYGTTINGGAHNLGTIFKVTPSGTLTTLVSFDGTDNGSQPYGGLLLADDGNFYGMTTYGGGNDEGTAFKLTPEGTLSTMATFSKDNGRYPYGGLVEGSDGILYGTTTYGGANSGLGNFFKITISPEFLNGPATVSATAGQDYSFTYQASGFPAPTYTVIPTPVDVPNVPINPAALVVPSYSGANGTLPPGLTLSPDGLLSGKPTRAGTFTGSVQIDNGSAPAVTQAFTIKVAVGHQTITFPEIGDQPYGKSFLPKATASSGLAVRYTVVSGPATVTGSRLNFTGVGRVVLRGSQPGSGSFYPAKNVDIAFRVIKGSQTIKVPTLRNQKVGTTITLKATATSGLPVTFKVTGAATLEGNQLTTTGPGSVYVGFYQTGNANYAAAPIVRVKFQSVE